MYLITSAVLFLISLSTVVSTPVRTSLCCCGCSEDPCPVVGPSCGSPKDTCDSVVREETVQCSELQRLWELAEIEMKNGTKRPQTEDDRLSPSFTPFLNENGQAYEIHERGFKGSARSVEVVNQPGFPLPSDSDFISNIALPKIDEIKKSSSEIRRSPVKNISSEENAVKKLETMMSELQTMMDMVKGLMHAEVQINRPDTPTISTSDVIKIVDQTNTKLESGEETEMEKQVIDDVIRKMKRAFRKIELKNDQLEEIPQAAGDVTVSGDLMENVHDRSKRDISGSKKEGNCNDFKLREIIMENIGGDAKTSKRLIQKAAEKQFGGTFNVICSPCEFSFVVSSQKFCEGIKDQVACFAFLQPPTTAKSQ